MTLSVKVVINTRTSYKIAGKMLLDNVLWGTGERPSEDEPKLDPVGEVGLEEEGTD